jgi:hypothetical protein
VIRVTRDKRSSVSPFCSRACRSAAPTSMRKVDRWLVETNPTGPKGQTQPQKFRLRTSTGWPTGVEVCFDRSTLGPAPGVYFFFPRARTLSTGRGHDDLPGDR